MDRSSSNIIWAGRDRGRVTVSYRNLVPICRDGIEILVGLEVGIRNLVLYLLIVRLIHTYQISTYIISNRDLILIGISGSEKSGESRLPTSPERYTDPVQP